MWNTTTIVKLLMNKTTWWGEIFWHSPIILGLWSYYVVFLLEAEQELIWSLMVQLSRGLGTPKKNTPSKSVTMIKEYE